MLPRVTGTADTRLIVLRGNSGSGKSSTLVRHATRELAAVVGADAMRSWYQARDLMAGVDEEIIDQTSTLAQTVSRILADIDWKPGDTRELTPHAVS
ncbi:MAG: hypothetical protein QOF10_4299 [Kribbellaceae bacterium]|jgi:ribose 1,5-bisphosphokinase PhnN|nr:hypothetical protein [Kribbellaceae bacterium]